MAQTKFSGPVVSTNGFVGAITGSAILPTYTTVQALALPTAGLVIGTTVFVSDGLAGLPTLAVWDGSAWKNTAGATIND